MKRYLLSLVLALLAYSTPLGAQSPNAVVLITLNGQCWLTMDGKERQCVPKLNTNYPDGRTGFYIVSVDDETYAWSGKGGHKPSPDSQVLLVDQFIATIKGKSTGWPAKGSCQYQNPYRGKPTTFTCKATYGKQTATFRFEHDGVRPTEDEWPLP
jgi:hypothetical protein